MLAQAVTGTPGHINSMALAVKHFIDRFPVATMREGDIFITNDPWKGTGHLHDLTGVTPTFLRGKLLPLFVCTSHIVDICGLGLAPDARQVHPAALLIPSIPMTTQRRSNAWFSAADLRVGVESDSSGRIDWWPL